MLGIKGCGKKNKSIPVGSETFIDMKPLDFEEFLYAHEISEKVIDLLKECLNNNTPVPKALHRRMLELILQYTVVGGMIEVVQKFIDTKQMNEVLSLQRNIVNSYIDDMIKYIDKKDKSLIRECFLSIPKQLSKENKKFQYFIVKKGATAFKYLCSLEWIEDAYIISRCYNLVLPELPLEGNAK